MKRTTLTALISATLIGVAGAPAVTLAQSTT